MSKLDQLQIITRWVFIGIVASLCLSMLSVIWQDAAQDFYSLNIPEMIPWIFIMFFVISVFGWIILEFTGLAPESREEKLEKRIQELEIKVEEKEDLD